MGATCVRCNSHYRCTNARVVTRSSKCSICADDRPSDCYAMMGPGYVHGGGYGGGSLIGSIMSVLFLFVLVCAVASCFRGAAMSDPVVVTGMPAGGMQMGQPGYGAYPGGQTVVYQQGGYGYGGGGVATGAAAGFVGGVLVGEALDAGHGCYGGGYGGGYGGMGGGYGADE